MKKALSLLVAFMMAFASFSFLGLDSADARRSGGFSSSRSSFSSSSWSRSSSRPSSFGSFTTKRSYTNGGSLFGGKKQINTTVTKTYRPAARPFAVTRPAPRPIVTKTYAKPYRSTTVVNNHYRSGGSGFFGNMMAAMSGFFVAQWISDLFGWGSNKDEIQQMQDQVEQLKAAPQQ